MTSVVIADDQDLVRSGLELVLQSRGCEVLGMAADGRAAVEMVRRVQPDVVLIDIRMPVLDGVAATREITASAVATRVLVLTTYGLDSYVYGALKGRRGRVPAQGHPTEPPGGGDRECGSGGVVARALPDPQVDRGARASARAGARVPGVLRVLTDRELEVFRLIARGLSNDEIAAGLVVTPATVKTHVNRILAKLGWRTRVQLVVLGYETGLVRPIAGQRPRIHVAED